MGITVEHPPQGTFYCCLDELMLMMLTLFGSFWPTCETPPTEYRSNEHRANGCSKGQCFLECMCGIRCFREREREIDHDRSIAALITAGCHGVPEAGAISPSCPRP